MDINTDHEDGDFHIKKEASNHLHYNDNNPDDVSEEYNDDQDYLDDDVDFASSSVATDADQNNHQQQTYDNNMSDNNPTVQQSNVKDDAEENNLEDGQQDETIENSDNQDKVINDDETAEDEEEAMMEDQDHEQNDDDSTNQESTNQVDPSIWTLPADKNVCTLEEIRRGQQINKVPPTMCPVIGCGKIINEAKAEPSPGTIASGLRTHVLFVHYATQQGRKNVKKRKALGWTNKKRYQSPRKHLDQIFNTRFQPNVQSSSAGTTSFESDRNKPLDLKQQQQQTSDLLANLQKNMAAALGPSITSGPGSVLDKKVKQMAANKSLQVLQMSSHQSMMQATGSSSSGSGIKQNSTNPVSKQKNYSTNNTPISSQSNNNTNFNSTTSSLFSILAGLTAQQQKNPSNQQSPISRNIKTAHGTNTINISQLPRNTNNNISSNNNNSNNRVVNSSLLTLLNEKISGNVASSLQKTLLQQQKNKMNSSVSCHVSSSPKLSTNSYYHSTNNNDSNNMNTNGALLGNFCNPGVGLGEDPLPYDTSMPLNSFVETIALRNGSNIGPSGIAEVKKFIEKFTTSLICSSQTVADHYIAPYGNDISQQKPEISPSDVNLAYKMMNKS